MHWYAQRLFFVPWQMCAKMTENDWFWRFICYNKDIANYSQQNPSNNVKISQRRGAKERKLMLAEERFGQILNLLNKVHGGAILTNRCPNPKYKQYTLVKETEL